MPEEESEKVDEEKSKSENPDILESINKNLSKILNI